MSASSIVLAARVVHAATGVPVRALDWGQPRSCLYELLNGPYGGECGPLDYLASLEPQYPLFVLPWLAVTKTGGILLRTATGYRPASEVVL